VAGDLGWRAEFEEEVGSVPGTRITDRQAHLYMSYRKHHTQEVAAAKAGISERSARRLERDERLPSQKPRRY